YIPALAVMGKTRAEIQKAYRERKKSADENFLVKERQRQAKYRIPAAELSKKKLRERRMKNIDYCAKYRLKKALKKQT
ncbi:hypothetical protein NL287_28070, partial [Klebsiella pneumoniae]|nr:hypothetical protein [Klebsiella pneumoniae]